MHILKNEHDVKHFTDFVSPLITPTFNGTVIGSWGSSQGDLILRLAGQITAFASYWDMNSLVPVTTDHISSEKSMYKLSENQETG